MGLDTSHKSGSAILSPSNLNYVLLEITKEKGNLGGRRVFSGHKILNIAKSYDCVKKRRKPPKKAGKSSLSSSASES